MSAWKFYCESKDSIPLPPEYTFPQAFNYLNDKNNSFYILESPNGNYIQCGGDRTRCTVEVRYYDDASHKTYRHFTLGVSPVADETCRVPMTHGHVEVRASEVLDRWKAIQLFDCFFKEAPFPPWVSLRQVFL